MRKFTAILLLVLVVSVAGLLVVLGTVDLPAPTQRVEVAVPNDRLSQ